MLKPKKTSYGFTVIQDKRDGKNVSKRSFTLDLIFISLNKIQNGTNGEKEAFTSVINNQFINCRMIFAVNLGRIKLLNRICDTVVDGWVQVTSSGTSSRNWF